MYNPPSCASARCPFDRNSVRISVGGHAKLTSCQRTHLPEADLALKPWTTHQRQLRAVLRHLGGRGAGGLDLLRQLVQQPRVVLPYVEEHLRYACDLGFWHMGSHRPGFGVEFA